VADAYRIAFEEQLSRNRALAKQLVKLYSPRRGRPSARKGAHYVPSACQVHYRATFLVMVYGDCHRKEAVKWELFVSHHFPSIFCLISFCLDWFWAFAKYSAFHHVYLSCTKMEEEEEEKEIKNILTQNAAYWSLSRQSSVTIVPLIFLVCFKGEPT